MGGTRLCVCLRDKSWKEVVDFCNLWQLDAQCADYLACQAVGLH